VRHVDILDFVDRAYRKVYAAGYLAMVDRAPELWGYLYEASDRVPRESLRRKLVRAFDRMEFARFRALVKDFAPDVVLATHFLAAQVFTPKERRKIRFRFGLVVTDFDVHAFWIQPHADVTFVATEELRAVLAGRGVDEKKIVVAGIPVMPAFAARHDRRQLRAVLGIEEGMPAVLVMGGGLGVGSMRAAVEAALSVFGFVTNMHDLMAAADLAVTKSGGLTTAECLASSLPMVIRDPIPGQEERNSDFVLEAGAGVKAHGSDSLRFKLESLLSNAARLARMKEAARAAGNARAAEETLSFMLRR
jgi:processive 1,2-diacylglycerol beta-glucosyltransferase